MREVDYQDALGCWYRVRLPDNASDDEAPYGIVVGPPDLSDLGLPTEVAVSLNNQLFHRKLLTHKEAARRPDELFAAWQAALKTSVQRLLNLYGGA